MTALRQASPRADRSRPHLMAMCAGWDIAQLREIVQRSLHDVISRIVLPGAIKLIESHSAAGRDVVIVNLSGEDIVAPIAAVVGALATRRGWPGVKFSRSAE